MRIATWNLERASRTCITGRAQDAVLREIVADLAVITEPGPSFPAAVLSPPLRRGESWVALVGRGVEPAPLDVPFTRMAAAGLAGRVVLYGSVLPWPAITAHAPELLLPGETSLAAFLRVLDEQVSDLCALRARFPDHLLIWAGDFNQCLEGLKGPSPRRYALAAALASLDLVAWNADADHASPPMRAIDLICGPRGITPRARGRIASARDGRTLSDHAGYWVDL